jgi:hypothetical protein
MTTHIGPLDAVERIEPGLVEALVRAGIARPSLRRTRARRP